MMMDLFAASLAMSGTATAENVPFDRVSTDSRKVLP